MSRIPAATPATNTVDTRGATDLREVDLDQFLQLLITEMQNQDPLNPLDNSEILQQISQIREISATNQLSDTLGAVLLGQNMATANSMLGKRITALSDSLENVVGVVERVSVVVDPHDEATRTIRVHVDGQEVKLENVREVVSE